MEIKVDINFLVQFNQKEFSVMTRALAGHTLKEPDLVLARELNMRLLETRKNILAEYQRQCARALEVAEEEHRLQESTNTGNEINVVGRFKGKEKKI